MGREMAVDAAAMAILFFLQGKKSRTLQCICGGKLSFVCFDHEYQ